MNTAFWILAWLSFSGALVGESHGQTSVSGELSVKRALNAQVSGDTSLTGAPNFWYALRSTVVGSSDADTTYLSARRPFSGDEIVGSSNADGSDLSRWIPLDANISGASTVSVRVTVNPKDIDDVSSSGSSSVSVDLERFVRLPADDIFGESSVYGDILPDVGMSDGQSDGITDVISELNLEYAVWSEVDGSLSGLQGHITVNAVEIDGDSAGDTDLSGDLSVRVMLDGSSFGSTDLIIAGPDILRTLRISGESDLNASLVSSFLNREVAHYSLINPKSQVSATPNVHWAIWVTLTTAPLSNTRLDNTYLSVRWETSVSITNPRTDVVSWAATKFKVESQIEGFSVVWAEKMTLNPVWFTGLLSSGSSDLDVDLKAKRRAPADGISGSSSLDVFMNRYGACWSVLNPKSHVSGYLNRWVACWSTINPKSIVSGNLSVQRSISAVVEGVTSVNVTAIRKRNMEVETQGESVLTGHITVNLKAITDGVSECSSSVTGELRRYIAIDGSSSGDSDLSADSYRKRNLEGTFSTSSEASGYLSAWYAIWSTVQPQTTGFFHLSRRFYLPNVFADCRTDVSVYLSAIRPLEGVSTSNATSISATAYRKRNAVSDLIFGYSVVNGRITVNGREITDGEVPDCRSEVTGDIMPYRMVEGSSSGSSSVDAVLNVERALFAQSAGTTECTAYLNAWYACWVNVDGQTSCPSHLSRRFYLDDSEIACSTIVQAWLGRKLTAYADSISCSSDVSAQLNVKYGVSSWVADPSSNLLGRITVNPVEIDGDSSSSTTVFGSLNEAHSIESVVSGSTEVDVEARAKRAVFAGVSGESQAWMDLNVNRACFVDLECESDASGLLNKWHAIHTEVNGLSEMTAVLGVKRAVESVVSGATDITGRLIRARFLEGTSQGQSSVTGRITKNPVYLDVLIQSWSNVEAYLSADRWFNASIIHGSSSVYAGLSRYVGLEAIIYGTHPVLEMISWWMPGRWDGYEYYLNVYRHLCNRSFLLPPLNFLSATRPLSVDIADCKTTVLAHLSTNAKELSGDVNGSSSVYATLHDEDRLHALIEGVSSVHADLNIIFSLSGACEGVSDAGGRLNVKRGILSLITSSGSLAGRIHVVRYMTGDSSDGSSDVSASLSLRGPLVSYSTGSSSVLGVLGLSSGIFALSSGGSSVIGSLSLKGAIYDGDEGGVVSQSGGTYRLVLVSEDLHASLPDWMPVSRAQVGLLSGLLESFRLSLSERSVFELTPLSMDPRHFLSLWECSLQRKPSTVSHPVYGFRIIETGSWFELIHSPMPRWMWEDGRLYVSRLAMGMEQLMVHPGAFRLASSVRALSTHPVYLLWTLPECDIAYLVPRGVLRWSSGRLTEISPRFGYLIHVRDDLQLGASYGQFVVSAKASVWLTFQSSSGGDSVPECAPVQVDLTRTGFISVIVHSDTVRLSAVRGEPVVHPAEGSLTSCSGGRGELVGVFVGSTAPSGVIPSNDRYAPSLGQVFVVESGARYIVPQGATRLMLGILHDGAYRHGFGNKRVTVHQYEPDGSLSVVYTDSYRLRSTAQVLVDGRSVELKASSVESRFTMWMRLLGHPMSFRGWNGYDYMNYLRGVGFRVPLIPGIPPLWYTWDGQSDLVISGVGISSSIRHMVDVNGIPSSVVWEGVAGSGRLPYYPSGTVFVDGRPGSPVAGSTVRMRVTMWSSHQSGSVITVKPSPNMKMISGEHLVGVTPYEIKRLPFEVTVGGDNPVFIWSDEVS